MTQLFLMWQIVVSCRFSSASILWWHVQRDVVQNQWHDVGLDQNWHQCPTASKLVTFAIEPSHSATSWFIYIYIYIFFFLDPFAQACNASGTSTLIDRPRGIWSSIVLLTPTTVETSSPCGHLTVAMLKILKTTVGHLGGSEMSQVKMDYRCDASIFATTLPDM